MVSLQPGTMPAKIVAFLGLWWTSTAIGVTMKISQKHGQYDFNPASAVVMIEAIKLVMSLSFQCRKVAQEGKPIVSGLIDSFRVECNTKLVLADLGLAISYMIVNNITFAIMIVAPSSSFFLFKATSPVLTAIMLWSLLSRPITSRQWLSIVMQTVGLLLTQYDHCAKSSTLRGLAYALILTNLGVSCVAGVWNEQIIKGLGASIHIQNAVLYMFGIILNLLAFFFFPAGLYGARGSAPFFHGYTVEAWAVIFAQASVGLIITAVYKYADVVLKTFGIGSSTVSMYLMEYLGLLPAGNRRPNRNVLVASIMVFYASYLYMVSAPPKPTQPPTITEKDDEETPVLAGKPDTDSTPATPTIDSPAPPKDNKATIMWIVSISAVMCVAFFSPPCSIPNI